MANSKGPTIVVLGAGYAGISVAHQLLKNTLPKVPGLKVVIVAPNTHFYWIPAAVRAVTPGGMPDDKFMAPIEPAFTKQYPAGSFEFVIGIATGVDADHNVVYVASGESKSSDVELNYDQLVIATGSSMKGGMPFKPLSSTKKTKDMLHSMQRNIGEAKNVVVAGGGATGVETAAELGERYGVNQEKNITLVVAAPRVLDTLQDKVSSLAEEGLRKLGVKVVHSAKVVSYSDDAKEVELSTGEKLAADVYLPLIGVQANSSFLPNSWLSPKTGDLQLDSNLRVKDGKKNIWGAGDVGDKESKQIVRATPQAVYVASSLHAVLTSSDGAPKLKDYVPATKPLIMVTLGKKTGTGEIGGFRAWGWMVTMFKSKTLMSEKMPTTIEGK